MRSIMFNINVGITTIWFCSSSFSDVVVPFLLLLLENSLKQFLSNLKRTHLHMPQLNPSQYELQTAGSITRACYPREDSHMQCKVCSKFLKSYPSIKSAREIKCIWIHKLACFIQDILNALVSCFWKSAYLLSCWEWDEQIDTTLISKW